MRYRNESTSILVPARWSSWSLRCAARRLAAQGSIAEAVLTARLKSGPDTCIANRKHKRDAVWNPTLAAKPKTQEPASQQEWGTLFVVKARESRKIWTTRQKQIRGTSSGRAEFAEVVTALIKSQVPFSALTPAV
jgi:hypothetical protein